MAAMKLLQELMAADPACPRLTVYDDQAGTHLDFSAKLLENWAAKVANMLRDELDLDVGDGIGIDLPTGWQSVMIALGAIAAGVKVEFGASAALAEVVFVSPDADLSLFAGEVVLVTSDPFGRGVIESGGELPDGALDFGPIVRMYGDHFPEPTPTFNELAELDELPPHTRLLSTGWRDWLGFCRTVLSPLAVGGSTVIVAGHPNQDRLNHIFAVEKATALLVL